MSIQMTPPFFWHSFLKSGLALVGLSKNTMVIIMEDIKPEDQMIVESYPNQIEWLVIRVMAVKLSLYLMEN